MEDKLREAVEGLRFRSDIHPDDAHVKPLLDLASKYLSIEGFPESMPMSKYSEGSDGEKLNLLNIGYEQALQDCKLVLLKKMEGIEKIIEDIETKHNGYFPITELAQAVRSHILGSL